jgi:hypothetical protein
MNAKMLVGGIAAMLALNALPLRAQTTVEGGVVVHSGPVTAGVAVGPPPPTVVYAAPVQEVIVVERLHVPRGNAYGWWKKHGYRQVTVYSDGDRYYSRRLDRRPGVREVVVYQREGRYYQEEDRDDHHGHGHGHGDEHHGHDDD